MNLQPYNLNYQDGLNSYPIIDYIDAKIAESGGNIIIDGQPLTNLIYSSNNNTYINNANFNKEIRFKTPVSYIITNGNYDYAVKINHMGKIEVYHLYNPLQPTFSAGWYDVELEIMALKADGISTDIQLTGLEGTVVFLQTEVSTIETALSSLMESSVYMQTEIDTLSQLTGNEFELLNDSVSVNEINSRFQGYLLRNTNVWSYKIQEGIKWAFGGAVVGAIGAIGGYLATQQLSNMAAKLEYSNVTLTPTERRNLIDLTSNAEKDYTSNFGVSMSNLSLGQGFINSNIITEQFIPTIKTNKIMIGNITTPNVAYQMEMTGDLNLNMLYLNSTSLSSLLNQKQGNLTFTQPLYNTTNTIGLNYDSTLQKLGNNLSVVKTATSPIVITGNDFSLSYDSSLTNISGNLSVLKTASLPLAITGNNWALNYDTATLGINGANQLYVISSGSSPWITSGTHIYNNNTGNVGIGSQTPTYKLDVNGTLRTRGSIYNNSAYSSLTLHDNTNQQPNIIFLRSPTSYGSSTTIYDWKMGVFDATGGNKFYLAYAKSIYPNVDESYAIIITQSGQTIIGGATPTSPEKLNIWSGNIKYDGAWSAGTSYSLMCINTSKRLEFHYDNGTSIYDNNRINFFTNSVERARITTAGYMGVATTSPIGQFQVGDASVTNSDGHIVLGKKSSSGSTRQQKWGYDPSYWECHGDFGNNNTVPASWIVHLAILYSAPNNACYINGSANMVILGTLTQGSDQRIKTDIKTIENSLWKVLQLRGVEYTLITEGTRNIGLIAQEVEHIIPEVVLEGERNDIKSVSYGNLVALLINAIKEQQEQINNLTKRIDRLENK